MVEPFEMPDSFPNPGQNSQAVNALLDRVRTLDRDARQRLLAMLDEEVDLSVLDIMEREYAKAFQRIAPTHAVMLRSRFVQALTEQREYLVDQVRKVLDECAKADQEDTSLE